LLSKQLGSFPSPHRGLGDGVLPSLTLSKRGEQTQVPLQGDVAGDSGTAVAWL